MDALKPYHRTPTFWLSAATVAYTAAAGAWGVMPASWRPELSEVLRGVLAGVGCLLPAAAAFSKVLESPRKPKT